MCFASAKAKVVKILKSVAAKGPFKPNCVNIIHGILSKAQCKWMMVADIDTF